MEVTAKKLIYLAILKQACRDYVEWKRANDSRLNEVEKFLRSINYVDMIDTNGDWLIDLLNSFAESDRKRFWRQDIAKMYKVMEGVEENNILLFGVV